jgi:hypothetical protein
LAKSYFLLKNRLGEMSRFFSGKDDPLSTKSQIPNSIQIPNFQTPNLKALRSAVVGFGVGVLFGIWRWGFGI